MTREVSQLQVADAESDDGGLIQLTGDRRRQRQHLGEFVELVVLLAPSGAGRVTRLLLAQLQDAATAGWVGVSAGSRFIIVLVVL